MATHPLQSKDIPFRPKPTLRVEERIFRDRGEHRYSLELLPARITFEVDRLRRSSHELWGEVSVTVEPSLMPSAKHVDGNLSIGDLNFSSQNARSSRAKYVQERAGVDLDWVGFMDEFCTKVITADRAGVPDVSLRDVPRPQPDRMFVTDGVEIPLKHPMILFGDGGTAKSYLSLYWAGKMTQQGHTVLYCDWEFTPDEHRERLEYLFGPVFPEIRYLSCQRSFPHEAERIKRVIGVRKVTYLMCDSIGLACGGDPNSSEAATTYFQALRGLGEIGSLHIAHVTKGAAKDGKGDDSKPFGSAFWHNMARITLNIKGEELQNGDLAVALHPRKRNLKGRGQTVGYRISFGKTQTVIVPTDVREHALLSEGLPLAERIFDLCKIAPKTRKELREMLDADYPSIQKTIVREIKKGRLVVIESGRKHNERIALAADREVERPHEVSF